MKIVFICHISFFVLILFFSNGYAQSGNFTPENIMMHSPNVTDLGKYGDYPVTLSTGVPEIELPLYTIKSGKLELPLSLSYHASGIKVDQEASFIGLGWTLNAGGVIARIVKDKEDQQINGFSHTGGTLPDYNSIYNVNGAGRTGNDNSLKDLYSSKDKEPDLFRIISKGLSGEFSMDNSGKYVSLDLDSLQYSVDLSNGLIIVKDKQGMIYRFGKSLNNTAAFENSNTSINGNNFISNYISSFYLTEIISADHADTISFKYKINFYSENKVVSSSRHILNDGGPLQPPVTDNEINHTSVLTTIPNLQVLDKILFRNGSVEFSTVDDRLDISNIGITVPSKSRITGFTVYGENRSVIKSVLFDNADYFSRTAIGSSIDGGSISSQRTKSLKLNAVKFMDKNGLFINDYKLLYDNTPLPPRNTTPQDFWGYYNGKNNSDIIPQSYYTNWNGQPIYVGENRNSDFNYMRAAVLNKITYPTGGYTTYDYEPNYYLNEFNIQNKVERTRSIGLQALQSAGRMSGCSPPVPLRNLPANNSSQFTVTEELASSTGTLSIMFTDFKIYNQSSMTVKITDLTDGTVYSFEQTTLGMTQRKIINQTIHIVSGHTYKIEANTNNVRGSNFGYCDCPFIEVDISYQYLDTAIQNEITPEQAGGLRVKSISNYNNDNTLITRKNYEYGNTVYGTNNVGVGTLITNPSKSFYNYPLLQSLGSSSESTLYNFLWFTSESQIELGANHGCPVVYNKVTEKVMSYDGNVSNGKTEYYFNEITRFHEPKASKYYPYESYIYPSWANNHLIKQVYYAQSGSSYLPVRSIKYEYATLPEKRIKTSKIIEVEPDIYACSTLFCSNNNPSRFYYYNFYVSRGRMLKSKEISTEYSNGLDSVVTEKSFEYNPYSVLSREWSLNSKAETVEMRYKYTSDLNYTSLVEKNIISLPAQTEELINGIVRRGKIFQYNDSGQISEEYSIKNSAIPVPYVSAASIPTYYEKKKSYSYDPERQNIRTVNLINSYATTYLWSYRNQYPIAEIKNTNYAAIEAALGGSTAVNAFTDKPYPTKEEIDAFLLPIRNSSTTFKDVQITTFTYKPLIGMISRTDTKGMTVTYDYDEFQRLVYVKDQNGNIVKVNSYHYKP